ncbi:MAG: CrcB family protein [Bacteroidia bacterium]|nr:CrcB family protein [Bacteroidia bacterium]
MNDAALPISELLLAGLGGGLGAGLRVWLRSMAVRRMHGTWRVTLGVNALGSILIAVMAAPLVDAPMLGALLVPGVLGGFTTFSGFALDAVIAIDERRWWRAVTIVLGTLVGCPLLCLAVLRWAGS